MRVDRANFLKVLESVFPGVAQREIGHGTEQSTCFVFTSGNVITFNDDLSCRRKSPLDIEGAVVAKELLDLMSKLPEDALEITQDGKQLNIKGKGRKTKLILEEEVVLSVDSIDVPKNDEDWQDLPEGFSSAVSVVAKCVMEDEDQFNLNCVHITPTCLEATDRMQFARYPLETGLDHSILLRGKFLKSIVGLDFTQFCETDAWVHFRNPENLIMSLRKYIMDYPDIDRFFVSEDAKPCVLPGGMEEIVKRCTIFTQNNLVGNHVKVKLKPDRALIVGEGPRGKHEEMCRISYGGDPIEFLISPDSIVDVARKSNECKVGGGLLHVDGGVFKFSTGTITPEGKE